MNADANQIPARMPCPRCATVLVLKPQQLPSHFPFCSDRCRLLDLGAWVDGEHQIAGDSIYESLDDDL